MRSVTQEPFQLQVAGENTPAESASAIEKIVESEVNGACSGGGHIEPEGRLVSDLDGDGLHDLIVAHDRIKCAPRGRSNAWGAQLCAINVYLNRDGKLKREESKLGIGVSLSNSMPPVISWHGMGGAQRSMVWGGGSFH